jgi:polysaccharide export outer membrane protein
MNAMKIRSHMIAFAGAVALLFAAPALAQQPPPVGSQPAAGAPAAAAQPSPSTSVTEGASSGYVLGRDDVVEVGLLGRNDFGGRARVQADGTIQLPFIGKVQAAEKTTADLSETVRKALQTGGFFADPVVTVEVVGYASRYVTVLGAVGTPGLVPINRPYRLSEILARVGGVRDGAADYLIVTSAAGEEKRLLIRDLASGDLSRDPYVAPGDKLYSPQAETFYIYGQVNGPGAYPIQTGMTVRMALAKAGGLTQQGSDKKLTATRAGKKVKLDLAENVQPGDVIVVGERLF